MADLDNLKDKYDGKRDNKLAETVKSMKSLTKQLEGKKESAPVRAAKQAISGFRSQWSGMDDEGKVGIGKGVPGIYYDTVAIPALAGVVDDKYAPEFAVEADKKAGKIREAIRKDMGIDAPRGALEHLANAGGTMLGQLPVPGALLNRVLSPVKNAGIAGKVATSPIEYLSPIVDPKKINYGVGTGFGGTIGVVGEMLEEDPVKKALGGLIQKYETGGKVGKVKSFFSAIDSAIDTLKQKKGTGEQILKEIEKAPGVKKEELELRKIREKLRDKKSITQDEVRALAAESPAPDVKSIILGGGADPAFLENPVFKRDLMQLERAGFKPVVEGRNISFINPEGKKLNRLDAELELGTRINTADSVQQATENAGAVKSLNFLAQTFESDYQKSKPKFEKYTTPGGENYREVLLTLPEQGGGRTLREITDTINKKLFTRGYEPLSPDQMDVLARGGDDATNMIDDLQARLGIDLEGENLTVENPTRPYMSGHFDEPNVLVHARVTDRTGPNGEKVLYVEEIQSDWHQQARKERDRMIENQLAKERDSINEQVVDRIGGPDFDRQDPATAIKIKEAFEQIKKERKAELQKEFPKDAGYAKSFDMFEGMSADDLLWEHGDKMSAPQKEWLRDYIERWELDVDGTPAGQAAQDQLVKEYDNWLKSNQLSGVPDAPFKNTSNEIAVKQILDMAANEGYDSVAFSPGSEHIKRYGMSQHFDTLTGKKDDSGMISLSGIKNDRVVVNKAGIKPEELADYIGKEKAERVLSDLENRNEFMLRGQDLEMTTKEGAGKKKIYDEIIPNYVRKYAKKEFGVEPGEIDISMGGKGRSIDEYLEEILDNPYNHMTEDEQYEAMYEIARRRGPEFGIDFEENPALYDRFMRRETDADDNLWEVVEDEMHYVFEQKAKELADKDTGSTIKAFSIPVTPEMREKITTKGQPLFSVAAPVAVGAPQVVPQAEAPSEPEAAPEPEEMPMPFQAGGQAKEDREESYYEEPIVRMIRDAAKQYVSGKDIESAQFGIAAGPVTVGRQAVNIREPGINEYMSAQADFARLAQKYGKGELTASVMKPDNTRGLYMGDVMASYPVGPGRVMAGGSRYEDP